MAKQMVITTREQVQSNMEVHGIVWTAQWAKKRGVPFSLFYGMAFGKAPRRLTEAPMQCVAEFQCLALAQGRMITVGGLTL